MDKKYIEYIAKADIRTYHYKILLLLNIKPYNQAEIANELDILKQNAYKYIKDLEKKNLVEVDRIEGRNKFYKAANIKNLEETIPGQMKIKH